jgi:ribosomal protein S18 acetylase RimI-like enzyme
MTIKVRDARKDDVRAIARVHVETWRQAYKDILPGDALAKLSVAEREAMWRKSMGDPMPGTNRIALVAVESRRVIGFCTAGREQHDDPFLRGEVYTLYVDPAHQGRGAGQDLLVVAFGRLVDAGLVPVVVWVLAENPARAFYERMGGVPVRERRETVMGREVDEVAYAFFDV